MQRSGVAGVVRALALGGTGDPEGHTGKAQTRQGQKDDKAYDERPLVFWLGPGHFGSYWRGFSDE